MYSIECSHCVNFFTCKGKEKAGPCVSFSERRDGKNKGRQNSDKVKEK